jgi:choline dehydrogenase-like flavoprotein
VGLRVRAAAGARRVHVPQGRTLGGSSSMNDMTYIRGAAVTKRASGVSSGILVHQIIGRKKRQRSSGRYCGLTTPKKLMSRGYEAWNEGWCAILSDCLEQQFEMVAAYPLTPAN